MATSTATSGFGTLLKLGDEASPEVWTTIAEITGLTGPGEKLDLIECTHMESPSNYKEYIPSLVDGGEVSIDLNFLPGNSVQQSIRTAMTARTKKHFQITWTNTGGTKYAFYGYVTSFQPSAKINDKLSASITIKVTSTISLT